MYVQMNHKRSHGRHPVARARGTRLPRGYRGLGDSCWIDQTTGAQVCGAGDPTGQTNCAVTNPYNTPPSSATAPDGTTWQWALGGNTLTGTPASKNRRVYTFLYHSGYTDVYQLTSGGGCSGFSCAYITVSRTGQLSFVSAAPTQSEIGCSNITSAVTTGSTTTTVSSQPVVTWNPQVMVPGGGSPYVNTEAGGTQKSGFSLSSIPTWAWIAGAGVGGVLIARQMGARR